MGYSTINKAYRVYNKRTLLVEESMHVASDESNSFHPMQELDENEVHVESWRVISSYKETPWEKNEVSQQEEPYQDLPRHREFLHNYPKD